MTDTPTPGAAPAAPAQPTAPKAKGLPFGLPDTRGWVALAMILLAWRILEMIALKPELTQNQGFMFLAQAIIVGGLIGGVVAYLYTASQGPKAPGAAGAATPDKPA